MKYQREGASREAAQFNGIVSEGPKPAWRKQPSCSRPSGYNFLHYGDYIDTPLAGIDYVIENVLDIAVQERACTIALPLLK